MFMVLFQAVFYTFEVIILPKNQLFSLYFTTGFQTSASIHEETARTSDLKLGRYVPWVEFYKSDAAIFDLGPRS